MSQFEQRANIKFMFKLEKTPKETLQALEFAYGDTASKKSAVYEWYHRFKNGQDTLEDEPCSGRPSTSRDDKNVSKVKTLI
jgi:transposase